MIAGNMSYETSNTQGNNLPEVSEYSLLNSTENNFVLFDIGWLYDIFHDVDFVDNDPIHYLRGFFRFENFLDLCITESDMSFIYDIVQPAVDDNSLSEAIISNIEKVTEKLYHAFHEKFCSSLIGTGILESLGAGHDHLKLVGFFGKSAVISLSTHRANRYPTFKEAYGNIGNKNWRGQGSSSPLLQTSGPFVPGKYSTDALF